MFSNIISSYISLTTPILPRHLTLYFSDTSFISQQLKTHSCPTSKKKKSNRKHFHNTQRKSKQKLQILQILYIKINKLSINKILNTAVKFL